MLSVSVSKHISTRTKKRQKISYYLMSTLYSVVVPRPYLQSPFKIFRTYKTLDFTQVEAQQIPTHYFKGTNLVVRVWSIHRPDGSLSVW